MFSVVIEILGWGFPHRFSLCHSVLIGALSPLILSGIFCYAVSS